MNAFRHIRLLGMISPMIVWAAYFVSIYALQGLGCAEGWQLRPLLGSNRLTVSLSVLSVIALAAIAWTGWRGWVGLQRGRAGEAAGQDAVQRLRFFGLVMLALAVLAFISTLLVALPVVMLAPCE